MHLDLGLKLGIKELLHGTSRHHVLYALAHYVFATVDNLDHIPHEHHPLAVLRVAHGVWVWLRQGACARKAPYSNPEPSQTSTWLCPTVNGMYKSDTDVTGTYRKNAYNLSWLRASRSTDFKTGPHANS